MYIRYKSGYIRIPGLRAHTYYGPMVSTLDKGGLVQLRLSALSDPKSLNLEHLVGVYLD